MPGIQEVPSNVVYCEMCGRPVERRASKIVFLEGARLTLCPTCYSRVAKRDIALEIKEVTSRTPTRRPAPRTTRPRRRESLDQYEVVQDYYRRVREARERLGWSQRVLAEAVKEGENVIKRIESGRLVPSIDLARRLERVLGIKLLEPVVESPSMLTMPRPSELRELTLGDIVNLRRKQKEK